MDINELLKLYQNGDYKNYCHRCRENPAHSETSKLIKESLKLPNLNEISTEYLLKNNEEVCHAIVQLGRDEQKWLESLNSFLSLFSNYKSLLVIPLELELTIVYNMLWWFWIRPQSLPCISHPLKTILKALSWCLVKVLQSRGDVALGQQVCSDNASSVVNLLQQASDQLLCLKPVTCIQLLDAITMTVQVFLREGINEAAAECLPMMTKIVDQIELIRLHAMEKKTEGNEEFYFKFGLKVINSTASLKYCRNSIDAFIVTSSLNCAVNEEYEQAINCFKGTSEEGGSYHFMMNYLKAHCCLMSGQLIEAKLCLAYAMSGTAPPVQLAHYRLLLARLLGAQGDHQAALAQCDAVLTSHLHHGLTSLATRLAAEQARKLNTTTAELNYLKLLVQSLKTGLSEDIGHFESFEECCLTTLTRKFTVSVPEALYTLARQLYLVGYHVKALENYQELLELVKTQVPKESMLLPCRSQLVQECVLAQIRANRLTGGEQLCRKLVSEHTPHTGGERGACSAWEVALYSLEDDVIALLLLTDLLTASGEKRKALVELNRCHSAVAEWREQAESGADKQLCDWLLSRVLLRKAKICGTGDAAHHFRRALLHRPGDKEVMFHYKQWSLWHPEHESFDPGDASAAVTFPVGELHNLAVRHLLGCSISEEEWNHLFDNQTSQNIIESLFDDED